MNENRHTSEYLKELQALPLERKIQLTAARIIEWYNYFEGKVYVSFSGGKDSTVLLDMARKLFPDIEAVFVDTGLEYPEIKEFIKSKENITTLRPKMSFKEVIEKYGYPVVSKNVSQYVREIKTTKSDKLKNLRLYGIGSTSGIGVLSKKWRVLTDAPFDCSEKCCSVMKKSPLHKYDKESQKHPIIGTMAHESKQRQTTWVQNGCNAFNKKNPSSQPMSFWTEQDVLHYIKKFNIPYASVYGDIVPKSEFAGQLAMDDIPTDLMTTGCQRTGCMFCMFGAHLEKEPNRFQRMKISHPAQYDYCMREENGLGLAKVLDYIGLKY